LRAWLGLAQLGSVSIQTVLLCPPDHLLLYMKQYPCPLIPDDLKIMMPPAPYKIKTGRKSKRSKAKPKSKPKPKMGSGAIACEERVMSLLTNPTVVAIPNGTACYICLGGGCNDEGKPLVRDCSCRGNAGFAHLLSIVHYAMQQCRQMSETLILEFAEPWQTCPNCNQLYQNQLALNLSSALVSFVETTYGFTGIITLEKMKIVNLMRVMIALRAKTTTLVTIQGGNMSSISGSRSL
jgi:hypothetical protein